MKKRHMRNSETDKRGFALWRTEIFCTFFFDQRSQSSAKIATLQEDALSNWLLCEKKTALCIGLSAILLFDPDQVVCIQFHFEKTQFRVAGGACSGV